MAVPKRKTSKSRKNNAESGN
ncbi:50S ribosomal protein L32 [Syntrophaceticus schinkii]